MPCRLALLGAVSLTVSASRSTRRAVQQRRLALLAILASAPDQSVSRDRLLGLLWPDRDERTARHLLADSLYVLRSAFGNRAIVASGEALRLSTDEVWSDVVEFQRAVADARWSEALDLYRGDFLDGFLLRNAAEFDRWALGERSRLRALATRAASALSSERVEAGQLYDAVAASERALEIAPHDEHIVRQLVRLLIAANNVARAEAVGRAFVERLAGDLAISPSAETMRLLNSAHTTGSALQVVVVERGQTARHARMTDSLTASIIAQGRHHWRQRTRPSVLRAIEYFTRAVERDARAVDAWCGLADCWVVMGGRGYVPTAVAIEHAAASAQRALALDDALSATHTSMGGLSILRRRWHDAEAAFRRAIAIDPANADARHWLSMSMLTGFGLRQEAIREQTIAAALNPASPIQVVVLGWQQYLRGEFDQSRSSMEPAVDLNADMEEGHAGLARVAARLGDDAMVAKTIAAGLTRGKRRRGDLLAEYASALVVLGDMRRARDLACEASTRGAMPANLALAWASLGDADRAIECLVRESYLVYWAPQAIWWDPRLDQLRDDRRFARVRDRVSRVWSPEWT